MSDCRLLETSPLRICKQMHAEMLECIEEHVPVKIVLSKRWDNREKHLLGTCKNLIITCNHPERKGATWDWSRQLEKAVSRRKDIKTFCFQVTSPYIKSNHYMSQIFFWRVNDLEIFEQVRRILRRVPKITVTKWVRVRWCGEEQLVLEDDVHVQEYLRLVARIESGLGGSGRGSSEDDGNG